MAENEYNNDNFAFQGYEEADQAKGRQYTRLRDQHERFWGTSLEYKSQDPCTPFEPQFTAPVLPPQQFLEMSEWGRIVIRYDLWLNMVREVHDDYARRMHKIAVGMYPKDPNMVARALEDPTDAMLIVAGPPPMMNEEILRACMAGNEWILGFNDKKPKAALQWFPDEPQRPEPTIDFVGGEDPWAEQPAVPVDLLDTDAA